MFMLVPHQHLHIVPHVISGASCYADPRQRADARAEEALRSRRSPGPGGGGCSEGEHRNPD
jgi:hypothetical protein